MELNRDDVEKVAHLARLAIDPADLAGYAKNLTDILEFVEQMNAVDTVDVAPMEHPLDAVQRLRGDVVTEEERREEFQAIAPLVRDGLYLVPRVVE